MSDEGITMKNLRTGKQVPESSVVNCDIALRILAEKDPDSVAHLLLACDDETYMPPDAVKTTLWRIRLITRVELEANRVEIHEHTRHAVQALVELTPDGELRFTNPYMA